MWLYVIAPFISLLLLLMLTVSIVCCRKFRKNDSRDGISNIHNINVSGTGKNIYGNSRLNSPIEMTSLLTVGGNQQENGNTNHESNATITSIQNQQHVASLQNGGKPQPSKQLQQQQQQQQQQHSYSSHRNNSFSLYKCPSQTNGGGSICGSIKSSDTGNDDTTSLCTTSDGGGGGGGGGGSGGCRSSSRGSALRVRQYMLHHVRFVEELGEGAFGKVYKGELTQPTGERIYVAVKALKENASAKTQADFRREIDLISDLKHDNIVCILGVVLKEEPLCMLFEYMAQGDLHEFLISHAPSENCPGSLSQTQFLHISLQICDGMEYLASHHYVHRDLAARNCLVGDNLTVKISDFGLSRDIYSSDYYRVQSKSLLPVRWMPSESILYGKFTTESDVWSYGVVLWEIYSYGLQPYYGYSNQEVINMVRSRQLLPCPDTCPSAVYSLMVECWHEQAVRRPLFAEIGHRLKIWYQNQKRKDEQGDASSNGPSRKGSTMRINSMTPSSSNQHIVGMMNGCNGGGGGDNTSEHNRTMAEHDNGRSSSISSTHSPHRTHTSISSYNNATLENQNNKSHHHSLDRESNNKSYREMGTRQFYNTNPKPQGHSKQQKQQKLQQINNQQIARQSMPMKNIVAKSQSNLSNNLISKSDANVAAVNSSDECLNNIDRMSIHSQCNSDIYKNRHMILASSNKSTKQYCKYHNFN